MVIDDPTVSRRHARVVANDGGFLIEDTGSSYGLYVRGDIAVFSFQVAKGGDQEGLGLVAVEAMGCGLSVVVSDLPAIHDVIQHDETSLLCPPRDPPCLAKTVKHLLADEANARRLAEKGGQRVVLKFDLIRVAANYSVMLKGEAATTTLKKSSSL